MKYLVLECRGLRKKPRALVQCIYHTGRRYGLEISRAKEYRACDVLVLYGYGGAAQQKAIDKHTGPYVALDLGYWDRDGFSERKWRVSINGFHCPQYVLERPGSPDRFRQSKLRIHDDRRKSGPILLIGNAPKSRKVGADGWSAAKMLELRKRFPGQKIVYRPKPGRPVESGIKWDWVSDGPIDDELVRHSLVVTRHSNVAIDACRLGVPVVCDDGAAAAIYPQSLQDWKKQPSKQQRIELMQALAWWQWSIHDIKAGDFWPWLEHRLSIVGP